MNTIEEEEAEGVEDAVFDTTEHEQYPINKLALDSKGIKNEVDLPPIPLPTETNDAKENL
jgi:hypothetical protein